MSSTTSLDARFPVLLLPVSVQVKFVPAPPPAAGAAPSTYELRVRLYPDQLGIGTHQPALTAAEQEAGRTYWQRAPHYSGPTVADQLEQRPSGQQERLPASSEAVQLHDRNQWRGLVARFGAPRALWIVRQTTPQNPDYLAGDLMADPDFPTQNLAADNWAAPARARGLPDKFVVQLYTRATATEVADSPAKTLLFGRPGHPYDPTPEALPHLTTEFLHLKYAQQGTALGPDALAVSFHPDPAKSTPTDVLGVDADNYWTVDYAAAEAAGMAVTFRNLTAAEAEAGFARLVVLGVRAAGPTAGSRAVEELLTEHYYTDGVRLLPQGTPTNNTDAVAAGYSSRERADADATFALLSEPAYYDATRDWAQQTDGQHLASALGLRTARLPALAGAPPVPPLPGAGGYDLREAISLNRALWPATYGYFLEELLHPLLSPAALAWTRTFFEQNVLGRGSVPALRVGRQPYGILPTTRFSTWETASGQPYAERLQGLLRHLDAAWTERLNPQPGLYGPRATATAPAGTNSSATGTADFAAATPPDPTGLLTALALDATSTEYYQRYLIGPVLAEALNAYASIEPASDAAGPGAVPRIWTDAARTQGQYDALANPAYQEFAALLDPAGGLLRDNPQAPRIFAQTFQNTTTKLADAFADEPAAARGEGVLLDDQPLSETAPVAALRGLVATKPAGYNYIHWLGEASFDAIRTQNFTAIVADGSKFTVPNSLFYYLLRQAVLLEYWAAAKRQLGAAIAPGQARDQELYRVLDDNDQPRWAWLYDAVTGQERRYPVGSQQLTLREADATLREYLQGVARLAALPTARLERLLAEHLDLGSYRLDAWQLAPVTERLRQLRAPGQATATGSHLGAFGWLEDVRVADTSVPDADGRHHDDDNLGYLLTPSLTHGTMAAILRQGYKSRQHTADPAHPGADRMAVNLSSRRVRAAAELLAGLQGGLSLGTLLGQHFERGVTRHGAASARYLEVFRRAFPLAQEFTLPTGQAADPAAPAGVSAAQAARQVVDGAALLRAAGRTPTYPFGLSPLGLPAAGSAFANFVTELVAELADNLDALGDLGVSEAVYQAARGNTERAGAVLESLAQGQFPVQPEVVQPPQRGLSLTQRVLVQLPAAGALPTTWPAATPRAAAAPRLNAWLSEFFPSPAALTFRLRYRAPSPLVLELNSDLPADPAAGWLNGELVTLAAAGLHPIDLLYLLDGDGALQTNSALDRLLVYAYDQQPRVIPHDAQNQLADHATLAIDYGAGTAPAALRRLLPLLARLRQLLGNARPAGPHDLQAPGRLADANPEAGLRPDGSNDQTQLHARLSARQAALGSLSFATAADFYQAALYGVAEALPGLALGVSLAPLTTAKAAAQARTAAAAAALTSAPATGPTLATELERAAALFGAAFRPDVEFALAPTGTPATDPRQQALQAYTDAVAPATTTSLLRHHAQEPLALPEWLHGLAAVREPMQQLGQVLLIRGLLHPELEGGPLPLRPAQLVSQPGQAFDGQGDYWLGLGWPTEPVADPRGQLVPPYIPPADALSLVQWLPTGYVATGWQAALWLDEWAESLPLPTQTAGLTFHFDQPNSEAPQTLLLVVPPQAAPASTDRWTLDDLFGAVNETLDLAKKRTVEPDQLAATPLATVLPAVVAPVAQQAVTLTLDLGHVNHSHRFSDEPLAAL